MHIALQVSLLQVALCTVNDVIVKTSSIPKCMHLARLSVLFAGQAEVHAGVEQDTADKKGDIEVGRVAEAALDRFDALEPADQKAAAVAGKTLVAKD